MPNIPLLEDDIDVFFSLGELAVPAVFNGEDIAVIYREDFINVESGIVGVDNNSPLALAKITDVIGIKQGDPIEIDGDFFVISAVRPARSELYVRLFLEVA